jgi:fucose permease
VTPLRRPASVYLVSFVFVGLSMSMLGPALTELRERSGTDIGGIGVLFVGHSAGFIVGSLALGRLYDRFDGHRVFAGSMLLIGVGLAFVPVFDSLGALFAIFVLIGVGGSAADVGANLLLMWELGDRVGRTMNLLHLSFGVGALCAPLLVHVGLDLATRSAAIGCALLAAWALSVRSPGAPATVRDEHTDTTPRLVLLLSTFFVLYVGLEVGFAGWIHTYGGEIGFSDLAATWLTSTFWIGFTFGRLLSSLLAHRIRPKLVLVASCGLTVAGAAVLVASDGRSAPVWVGTGLMGLATAPQFPGMLTYLERRIRVTGAATARFIGGAGVGGLAFPWLIGRWFDASGATALPWSMLFLALLTIGSFGVSNRVLGG